MPSQGSAGFLSGFQRSLFPGLNRGAELLAGGWASEDDFKRQMEASARAAAGRMALQRQKRQDTFDLADKNISAKRSLAEEVTVPAAMERTKEAGKYRVRAAQQAPAGAAERQRRDISDEWKQRALGSLHDREEKARAAIEAAREAGPVQPDTITAIKNEFMADLTEAERQLIRSKEYVPFGAGRSGKRTAADQARLNEQTFGHRKALQESGFKAREGLEGAKAGVKLLSDPTLRHLDPELHKAARAAAQRLVGSPGAKLTVEEVRAAGRAFEAANGRRPSSEAELEAFLGKGQ